MCRIPLFMHAALISLVLNGVGLCQAASDDKPGKSTGKTLSSSLADIVHPRVAKMGPPQTNHRIKGVQSQVSTSSTKAREHVMEGFALVHAQWHFEAYRQFCAALASDSECIMAYAGVALALIQPFNEYAQYRTAAVARMMEMVEEDKARAGRGDKERYSSSEKRFVEAIDALVANKPEVAGEIFLKLARADPRFIQANIIGIFLNRGGYNVANEPSQQRLDALEQTRRLMKDHPDNLMIMGFWLMLNAEAPNSSVDIKKEILPYARFLAKTCPAVPTWQHALGHFEWRAGNYMLAEQAFRRAIKIYEEWMQRDGVALGDCDGYVKSTCYLANTLYQMGDFEGAMQVAMGLRALKPDPARPQCAGNQMILWRAYHLPARLLITLDGTENLEQALQSLPSKDELQPYVANPQSPTLAGVYVEALETYIGARKALEEKSVDAAKTLRNTTLRALIKELAEVVDGAMKSPDFTHYFNAGSSLAVYDTELAGLIALGDDASGNPSALNHFMSARDKQGVPSLMMPPLVLSAMENRVGDYYYSIGRHADAYEAYYQGLERYPHNMASLEGVRRSLINLGEIEDADRVARHIDLIRKKEPAGSSN